MKINFTQTHQSFTHLIKSKSVNNQKLILFSDYDYFLSKRDMKILVREYQYIFIIPSQNQPVISIEQRLLDLLPSLSEITWVNNAEPTKSVWYLNIIHEFNKPLHIINVQEFCETRLKKIYISARLHTITLLTNLQPLSYKINILKRVMDVSASSVLIGVTIPIWVFSNFIIKKQSPGPAFYRQKRVGLNEEEFDIVKFRSMRLDAEANGAQFSAKNDNRTFPYGALMRATRIDELPQLINVFRGELSLIGPRPERKIFIDSFEEYIPHYNQRHLIKPGITGYAQVMYPYGVGIHDARHKLMYDLYYIKNWSIGLELKIIFRTIITILLKRGI